MAKPLPWSHTSLTEFVSCPKQFYHKRVVKDVVEEKGAQQLWGINVHKAFEDRQATKVPLPIDLQEHEPYMAKIEAWEGHFFTEQKIALDKRGRPVNNFFDPDVWYRGVIDWTKLVGKTARIIDYKTGKKKEKWEQLMMNAIWTFLTYPEIDVVDARFYWTVDKTESRKVWGRAEMEMLWGFFIGDLRQYAEAFKSETWQPRPSGLCAKWCSVLTCDHNGRRKGGKYERWKP